MASSFPFYRQLQSRDCGAVCLKMVAEYFGREYSIGQLRGLANQQKEGVSLLDISVGAESIGMHTVGAKMNYERLSDDIPLPGIAHWKNNHFVVVYEANSKGVTIADPASEGILTISVNEFLEGWTKQSTDPNAEGIILLMEPTAAFFSKEGAKAEKTGMKQFWKTALKDKRALALLAVSILIIDLLKFTFPFLLQMTVDESIEQDNQELLYVILGIWSVVFLGLMGMDAVRRLLLFHIGAKLNVKLLTDLMLKIVHLPAKFFRTRMTDDVIQLIYDNPRIQRFFIQDAVPVVAASFLLLLFTIALFTFSVKIGFVFLMFGVLQLGTVWFFLANRKKLNFERHETLSNHYGKLSDLIRGIREIKINNAEIQQRWEWEKSEAKLYRLSKKYSISNSLSMQLPHHLGELRNILIIVIAAMAVMNGEMSIGVLVATIYILLQLSNPFKEIIQFLLGWQETKMSLERMHEIHNLDHNAPEFQINELPESGDIVGQNVSFKYDSGMSSWVIQNLDFHIPENKTTVIIGSNGSGKSTLIKLLLNFLQPQEGLIKIGGINLNEIENSTWLKSCGVVQQDGHIFNTSIAKNIALGDEIIDSNKLMRAARIANLFQFLDRFKDGLNTEIGEGGTGLSKGQRQCILIARAVYKNPDYLILDEATNDLDSENEKLVLGRILKAFRGKTIIISSSRMNFPVKADHVIPLAVPKSGSSYRNELSNTRGGTALLTEGDMKNGEWMTEY